MTTSEILYNNLHYTSATVSNAMSLQVPLEKKSATSQKKKKKKNAVPQITSLLFELSKRLSYYIL